MRALVVLCGVGLGMGTVGCLVGIGGYRARGPWQRLASRRPPPSGPTGAPSDGRTARIALALGAGLVVAVATRWPVAAAFAGAGGLALPSALRTTRAQDATRRTEAVAVWTELLRDTLTASSGVAQAIVATSAVAPSELRHAVTHLADRITSGVPLDAALRPFAAEVDDPCADEVVAALRLVATSPAQRLVDLLSALAESTREVVAMRLRVEASRASARSGVRTIIWFSLGFVALLVVVARSYLAPFSSVTGQLTLLVVGALYLAGLTLMVRLVRPEQWRPTRGEVQG